MKKRYFSAAAALLLCLSGAVTAVTAVAAPPQAGGVSPPDKVRQRITARYDAWKTMDLKALYMFLSETKRKTLSYESFIIAHRPKMELDGYEILDLSCDTEESCGAEVRLNFKRLPVKGGGAGPVEIVKPERWIREHDEWYVYLK